MTQPTRQQTSDQFAKLIFDKDIKALEDYCLTLEGLVVTVAGLDRSLRGKLYIIKELHGRYVGWEVDLEPLLTKHIPAMVVPWRLLMTSHESTPDWRAVDNLEDLHKIRDILSAEDYSEVAYRIIDRALTIDWDVIPFERFRGCIHSAHHNGVVEAVPLVRILVYSLLLRDFQGWDDQLIATVEPNISKSQRNRIARLKAPPQPQHQSIPAGEKRRRYPEIPFDKPAPRLEPSPDIIDPSPRTLRFNFGADV